jgi:hypothetical protein
MMWRMIGGVVAGLILWVVAVTLLNLGLRHGMSGYEAVESTMAFTLPMLVARLAISAAASLVSGYGAATIGRRRQSAAIVGIVLLILFLPVHYGLLDKFPLWYHVTFLASLPLLSIAGGALAFRRAEAV